MANLSFIIHFGLFSTPPLSPFMHSLSRFDLVLHCVAFASLSIPAYMVFRSMIWTGLGIFLLGFALEVAQWGAMSREASITDLAANASGIALAAVIVAMLKKADIALLRPILGRVI